VGTIPCLNLAKSDSLDSSVCSITSLNNRVYCYNYYERSQLKTCSKEVVWESFFFPFFFFNNIY
jgi:hypothetical protein